MYSIIILKKEKGLTLNISSRFKPLQLDQSLQNQKSNTSNYKHNIILIFIIISNNNPFLFCPPQFQQTPVSSRKQTN